jgi:hypothetical protein
MELLKRPDLSFQSSISDKFSIAGEKVEIISIANPRIVSHNILSAASDLFVEDFSVGF